MNVELIVDSTVDVPERVRSRLTVVPLTIHFGQEEFLAVSYTHLTLPTT